MLSSLGRGVVVLLVLIGVLAAAGWAAMRFMPAGPEGRIVMATGGSGGAYQELATTYQDDFLRYGVNLELRPSAEGFATLRALLDPKSGIDAGFLKGGLAGSLQGRLASEKAKDFHEREIDKLRSVGRLFLEPVWVFTRASLPIESLRDLEGKKILTGTRQSGGRRVALQLLRANGVNRDNSVLVEAELGGDAAPLLNGEADAAIVIQPADHEKIQKLLRVSGIRLMNFEREVDAYTNRFPALRKVVLHTGAVEFDPLIPSADITLLATSVALVVRSDMHPALISLLTHVVITNPKSGFDKLGDPVLFHKAGEFPNGNDPEYTLAADARLVHRSGELPFLLRSLGPMAARMGMPFSVPAFANAHGAQTVLLLIPMLTVLIPLMRLIPTIYNWSIRRRLLYWYRQLKALERRLDQEGEAAGGDIAANRAEIERIDAGVRRIRVPLAFSDQFYDLRGHIDLVRQRLAPAPAIRMAAE